jgi:phosphoribosyl 1,2-cyclic phosphodiesterase
MEVCIWGARGSLPTPMTPAQFRRQVHRILARVQPDDLVSASSIEAFLDQEPMAAIHGGNTSCVSVRFGETVIVCDAGSGLRVLGRESWLADKDIHVLFTHFHWDHLCGLPFFAPLYNPNAVLKFHSWHEDTEQWLAGQMAGAYFPVKWHQLPSERRCSYLDPAQSHALTPHVHVSLLELQHPDGAYGYRIHTPDGDVCYLTDTEVSQTPKEYADDYAQFAHGARVVIVDAMYGFLDFHDHINFGHSTAFTWIDFFGHAEVEELVLFHHDPEADELALRSLLTSAREYAEALGVSMKITAAREGMRWTVEGSEAG